MLKKLTADLHIHTCLSPCGSIDMSPRAIVDRAMKKEIDIIAITDHNSAENVMAAQKAAQGTPLTVLCGMEVTTSEEAHMLVLFDDAENTLQFQEIIYDHLLAGENDEKRFGEQIIVNEKDEVLGFNNRLLIGATDLSVVSLINTVHSLGGLTIASHVDKEAFSILSQLGFIPDSLKFNALEMSPHISRKEAEQRYPMYAAFPWISASDAHYLQDIGRRTTVFYMNEPTIDNIVSALDNMGEKKAEWD